MSARTVQIRLSWTQCFYGGARPWLHCPFCERRVAPHAPRRRRSERKRFFSRRFASVIIGSFETHARRAYGAGSEAETSAAKAILKHIRKGDLADGFTAGNNRCPIC